MKFLSRLRLRMRGPTTRLGQSMSLLCARFFPVDALPCWRASLSSSPFEGADGKGSKEKLDVAFSVFFLAALCPVPTASKCRGVLVKTRAARRLERSRQTAAHSVTRPLPAR